MTCEVIMPRHVPAFYRRQNVPYNITLRRARAAMALAALSGDEQCIIFSQLCNVLDPGVAVATAAPTASCGS